MTPSVTRSIELHCGADRSLAEGDTIASSTRPSPRRGTFCRPERHAGGLCDWSLRGTFLDQLRPHLAHEGSEGRLTSVFSSSSPTKTRPLAPMTLHLRSIGLPKRVRIPYSLECRPCAVPLSAANAKSARLSGAFPPTTASVSDNFIAERVVTRSPVAYDASFEGDRGAAHRTSNVTQWTRHDSLSVARPRGRFQRHSMDASRLDPGRRCALDALRSDALSFPIRDHVPVNFT
ncbi:hypothetical protein DFJ74DRAFT_163092 [Hyaloraphidium curvatum]|nr:hypothetical protein DFJ74DRAFT_163092 [Hyaloraphidium curvatum]